MKIYPIITLFLFSCSVNAVSILSYQIIEGSFTWHEAKLDSIAKGGSLAILDSEAKMNQAYDYLMTEFTYWSQNDLWIGLTDEVAENEWKWVDGTDLSYSNWYGTGIGAEPNNGSGIEHYATIFRNDQNFHQYGEWNDRAGSIRLPYLLQTNVPEPTTYSLIFGIFAILMAFFKQ